MSPLGLLEREPEVPYLLQYSGNMNFRNIYVVRNYFLTQIAYQMLFMVTGISISKIFVTTQNKISSQEFSLQVIINGQGTRNIVSLK